MNDLRLLKQLNLSSSTDDSEKDLFKKSNAFKELITDGIGAEIIYSNNKNSKKSKSQPRNNEFVTDGGMREKNLKYYNSTKINNFLVSNIKESKTETDHRNQYNEYSLNESIDMERQINKDNKILIVNNIDVKHNNFVTDKKLKERDYSLDLKKSKLSNKGNTYSGNMWVYKYDVIEDSLKNTKRKNYQVPPTIPKSPPKPAYEEELKILTEEEKAERIGRLIQNYEDVLKYESQKEIINKSMKIDPKLQRKLRILKEKGILDKIISDDEDTDDIILENLENSSPSNNNENNIIKENTSTLKKTKHSISKSETKKPRIDTLEIVSLIRSEREKIHSQFSGKRLYKDTESKEMNSFRKSNSVKHSESSDTEYLFASKSNKRDKQEIYNYINYKKQQEKDKAVVLENEKNSNLLKKFAELLKVNEIQRHLMEQSAHSRRKKVIKEEKNKIKNTYYVGNQKFIINNEKDKEEYYKAIIQKKKLMSVKKQKPSKPRPEWKNIIERRKKPKAEKIDHLSLPKRLKPDKPAKPIPSLSREDFLEFLDKAASRSIELKTKNSENISQGSGRITGTPKRIDKQSESDIIRNISIQPSKVSSVEKSINTELDEVRELSEYSHNSIHLKDIIENLVYVITYIYNRRSFIDIYMKLEIEDVYSRVEYLTNTISLIVKANVFADVYNYGVIIEEYNQKLAEYFEEAFTGVANIYDKYRLENLKEAFELIRDKKKTPIESFEDINNFTQIKEENSKSSQKCYSYMYESISSRNSSIQIRPNSVDSPKLSRLMELINRQKIERSKSSIQEDNDEKIYDINYGHEDEGSKQINYSKLSNLDLNNSNNISNNKILPLRYESKSADFGLHKIGLNDYNLIEKIDESRENSLNVIEEDKSIMDDIKFKEKFNTENETVEIEEDIEIISSTPDKRTEPRYLKTEEDISADKYNTSDIEWQTISNSKSISNPELKLRDDYKDKLVEIVEDEEKNESNSKKLNTSNEYNDFVDLDIDINQDDIVKIVTEDPDNHNILSNKSRNTLEKKHNDDELNEISDDKELETFKSENFEEKLDLIDYDLLVKNITEDIVNEIFSEEIKKNDLIPKKSFKNEFIQQTNLNSSVNSSTVSNNSLNNSVFMKNVVDIKKENSLNIYKERIAPILINNISKEIENNYQTIINKLNRPYGNNSLELMVSSIMRDQGGIKSNSLILKKENKKFLDKKKILEDIANENIDDPLNLEITNDINITLNECLIDSANEILEKERLYGHIGEPLPWSCRTRMLTNKFINNEFSKSNLVQRVEKELLHFLNYKMGMLNENHDFYEVEQLNQEREKKLMSNITRELNENDVIWKNYEVEEIQVKVELSELVLEQMLNEIVEILEHVHLSRTKPSLYQYKSIYACEDIPRLSIQAFTEPDENINQ